MVVKKCPVCGKEFTVTNIDKKYCSYDCAYKIQSRKYRIRSKIDSISKQYDFTVKNKDKITNAKLIMFKDGDVHRCPCDASNPNRYCGSLLCLHDIIHNSHCHCQLFHAKKTLQDYEKGL